MCQKPKLDRDSLCNFRMDLVHRSLLRALLVVLILSLHALPTHTLTPEWEVGALEDLYHATHDGGRGWVRQDNWLTGDPCSDSWYGVCCIATAAGGGAYRGGDDVNLTNVQSLYVVLYYFAYFQTSFSNKCFHQRATATPW